MPGILNRRRARPRCALRLLFLQRDSPGRPRRRRRCRGVPVFSRLQPPLPAPPCACRDDAGGRLCSRLVSAHERRHRRAAFGLAIVIASPAPLVRLGHAGFVFAREGVFAGIDTMLLPPPARAAVRLARLIERRASRAAANRIAVALTRLGPTYVKLGQFLATRPDVVGVALARDLESLQDKMPPFPQAQAERAIETAFDKPLPEVFVSFGPPVAAASIAQVHRAEVATA